MSLLRGVTLLLLAASAFWGCGGSSHAVVTPDNMAFVPEGSFRMGTSGTLAKLSVKLCEQDGLEGRCFKDYFADEMPAHDVELDAYFIDLTEVPVGEYQKCVQTKECSAPGESVYCTWPMRSTFPDLPTNCVTWYQAEAYCAWNGKRLPTEAEWERASRKDDGSMFPWGNRHPSAEYELVGNFADLTGLKANKMWPATVEDYEDGHEGPSPIGSFPGGASPLGLLDTAGNVWEWVADNYDPNYYVDAEVKNPKGPKAGGGKVARGGSYVSPTIEVRSTARFSAPALGPYNNIGFRCAKSVNPPQKK